MDGFRVRWMGCLLLMLACGCGQGTAGPHSGDVGTSAVAPDVVVGQFLEAVRVGDDRLVAALLTPLARQKTAEMQIVVAPPGSETAQFRILGTTASAGAAQVSTEWTDLDTDGQRTTDQIVWNLRKVEEGWRIAGMETPVFEDRERVRLNFEDPAEMLSQQQLAEEELARRQRATQAKKQSPQTTERVR